MKMPAILVVLTLSLVVNPICAFGQSQQTDNEQALSEDRELLKARKANEEAQAEYYRQLTEKLHQTTPTPSPPKSFGQSIAENPASVIGIFAALIAALVALLTLFVNSRTAQKTQRDTQFYEALKRFGDKDSPTIRSSAAGLLAQMGRTQSYKLSVKTEWPFLTIDRPLPYLTTAVDQLLTGLLLEDNFVALKSISNAVDQLISYEPKRITYDLYQVNLKIQEDLGSLLAEFFLINGCDTPPNPKDTSHTNRGLWEQAHSLTGYDQWVLRDFVFRSNSFQNRYKNYSQALRANTTKDIARLLEGSQQSLGVTSNRLQINVKLYCTALGQCRWKEGEHHCFHHSFLVGGNMALQSAELSYVDLSFSQLTGMWLFKANMTNTAFIETDLKGASLHHGNLRDGWLTRAQLDHAGLENVDLTNTKLAEAKISDLTKLNGSNWWKSDFYLPAVKGKVDVSLLEKLFGLYGSAVPTDINELHASVREFIDSKDTRELSNQAQQNATDD